MVRPIRERNTITLPQKILDQIGAAPGDFLDIQLDGNRIVLTPQRLEDPFSEDDWEKLHALAAGKGKRYHTTREARAHIKKLRS